MIYFWLNSPELAIKRIKERVRKGGHHIPDNVVKRRYIRGLTNLFHIFIPLADYLFVINNSQKKQSVIAKGENDDILIYDQQTWNQLKVVYNEKQKRPGR